MLFRFEGGAGWRAAGASSRAAVSEGSLEALKWLALAAMTLDHVNRYLLRESWPLLHALGRMAMPIFAFVLACRLARPDALARRVPQRVMWRLVLAGGCALPLLLRLEGRWWPLNIMFTLLAATLIVWLYEGGGWRRRCLALLLFVWGGPLLDFWWFGLACFMGAWWFCRRPGVLSLLAWLLACASLYAVNGNHWGLAALAPIAASHFFQFGLPRVRYFFYAYYPAHFAALLALRAAVPA